jgi:hypothetical protein
VGYLLKNYKPSLLGALKPGMNAQHTLIPTMNFAAWRASFILGTTQLIFPYLAFSQKTNNEFTPLEDAWRKGQTARNDTVLLWTGTNADSHFAATRGRIPARLDCLFTMSESTGHKTSEFSDPKPIFHLALVTTFAPSNTIHKPQGMVIVEKREIRTRDYSTGRRRPQTGVVARYIVPVRAIQGATHLIPIKPGSGNSCWFLNNTVDLEIFNSIY